MSTINELARLNLAYRDGCPEVSDQEYDALHARLKAEHPDHPFFLTPEASSISSKRGRVQHIEPMLSTDKAYFSSEVDLWVKSVLKATGLSGDDIQVRITPKLDGVACFRASPDMAYTRGKGGYGSDISDLFKMGNGITGTDKWGAGEIVISKAYFDAVLAEEYGLDHPRNFIAGLLGADELGVHHDRALGDREVQFVSYADLPDEVVRLGDLLSHWEDALASLPTRVPYLCDGVVAELVDPALKDLLGSTSHHHRWQIAFKKNDASVPARVRGIRMTTGRTGRICPTVELEPVSLYGVTITWATAHNHARLLEWGCGAGATVEVTRGGGVIPKITGCPVPGDLSGVALDKCPSCGSEVVMRGPTAYCSNSIDCPAQAEARLQHFFKTIGVCKGFGENICALLCAAGYTHVSAVLAMTESDLVASGISRGVATNLVAEMRDALSRPFSEALFLAAFGIPNLGRGDSRKLLEVFSLDEIGSLTKDQIASVHGFGEKTSGPISEALESLRPEIERVRGLGWKLESAKPVSGAASSALQLSGETLVFTGAMSAPRSEMENAARSLGATIGSSVSAKTTLLVCGNNVGATKTEKAKKLGVRVISESEYLSLISGGE